MNKTFDFKARSTSLDYGTVSHFVIFRKAPCTKTAKTYSMKRSTGIFKRWPLTKLARLKPSNIKRNRRRRKGNVLMSFLSKRSKNGNNKSLEMTVTASKFQKSVKIGSQKLRMPHSIKLHPPSVVHERQTNGTL